MRRLGFLDSLRGLAAVYVMAFHLTYIPEPDLQVPHWAQAVVLNGGTAVTLFFVISAFSLCHTMHAHGQTAKEIRAFYVRRLFRIVPLFYAMVAFYVLRDGLYFGVWHTPWDIAKSVLLIFNFFPGSEEGIVWASWTIGVEMVFYAIFPFLFRRFRTWTTMLALFFACLLATPVVQEMILHLPIPAPVQSNFYNFAFLRHLPVFILGMLCWAVFDRYVQGRSRPASMGALLILLSLWAYHALLHGALNFWFTDAYYWQAVIYAALLLGLGIVPLSLFVNRFTQFCGKVSYSIYLIHPSVIFFLAPIYRRIYGTALPLSLLFLFCVALTLAVVLLLASLSYRWIEAPGMRLGKRLLTWLDQRAAERSFGPNLT